MLHKALNPLAQCQIKFDGTSAGEFEGYASCFGLVDQVGDTIQKGAYSRTLKARTPLMFVNHDSSAVPLGDWVSLEEDDTGLFVKGSIDMNHRDAPMVYSALKRGAMSGLSIGFRIPKGGSEHLGDRRIIKEVDLREISIVSFPCDESARISLVKEAIDDIDSLKSAEMILRDAGFSRREATWFVSRVVKFGQSESEQQLLQQINDMKAKLAHYEQATAAQAVAARLIKLIDTL